MQDISISPRPNQHAARNDQLDRDLGQWTMTMAAVVLAKQCRPDGDRIVYATRFFRFTQDVKQGAKCTEFAVSFSLSLKISKYRFS